MQIKTLLKITFGLTVCIGTLWGLWQMWPDLMMQSIQWQRSINRQLSDLVYATKEHKSFAALTLIGLSTAYGFLHALGPGHGKVIVTTYLATHPTKVKVSLFLTVISALMQAVVAIVIVSSFLWIFNASMKQVNAQADLFIRFSFLCMIGLGLYMLFKAVKTLMQNSKQGTHSHNHNHDHTHCHEHEHNHKDSEQEHTHLHDADCGCGHQHTVSPDKINQASHFGDYLGIVVSIGIRPCTGAIMVLLFSSVAQMYWLGVVSALCMSVGTALSTSTIALFTLSGKRFIQKYLSTKSQADNNQQLQKAGIYLQMFAAVLILLMGIVFYSSQSYGLSPVLVG